MKRWHWITLIGVIVALSATGYLAVGRNLEAANAKGKSGKTVASRVATVTPVKSSAPRSSSATEPPPFSKEGTATSVQSLIKFYLALPPLEKAAYDRAWTEAGHRGKPIDEFTKMVTLELGGQNLLQALDKDTQVTNTGFANGELVVKQTTLPAGTELFVDTNGQLVVKPNCRNPIGPARAQREVRIKIKEEERKRRKEEECRNERNPDAFQHVQDNKKDQVAPTPGYPGRGNAEQVVQQQESEPKGGTAPTTEGTPGNGNGGGATTPPGSGDGCTAPPPSAAPPADDLKGETPQQPVPED